LHAGHLSISPILQGNPVWSLYFAGFFQNLNQGMSRFSQLIVCLMVGMLLTLRAESFNPAAGSVHRFEIGPKTFLLDGEMFVIRSGEMHFSRIPREYWRNRLQMAKAMGLNTVAVYLFWNYHEPEPGKFNWSGDHDAAEFCRMAQEEGLWVILRPGPYVCAEWDFGGLPWWLLKEPGIQVRSCDPRFLKPARRYLQEVGKQLAPLQLTKGGPILMVQVENEYGSFGDDPGYMGAIRQALVDAGFDVPLYACNPRTRIGNGYRADLFQVANFGPGIWPKALPMLRDYQTNGPLMSGEYYPGGVGIWGQKTDAATASAFTNDLQMFLERGISFNIYMVHGGTTFGLVNGGETPFKPFVSSYDFSAPISEAGWPTDKYYACRTLFSQFLQPGEKLPPMPATNPVIAIPPFELTETATVMDNLPRPIADEMPRPMEHYNEDLGCIVYRTELAPAPAGTLHLFAPHDFGWCFLDGKPVGGVLDRRKHPGDLEEVSLNLPAHTNAVRLDLFIETMGRPNFFGPGQLDHKGLRGPVLFDAKDGHAWRVLKNWGVFPLPLDAAELSALKFKTNATTVGPAFWRGEFELTKTGDTFLDQHSWGKGVVWINGHCLGRFWDIGPQQTLYCPGPWLKSGRNEVIIFNVAGPRVPKLSGLEKPILDELHPELDFSSVDS
jgi:beta-galactosidase